jgi:hypothetical protein
MKIKLTNVRLSFPDLFQAVQYQGQGPFQYRAQFLVPANSPMKREIDKAIEQVAKEKWGVKAGDILKKAPTSKAGICFIDGDTKEYDGYAGHWALSATRGQDKGRPLVINTDKTPLTAADGKPYAGCYVHASVEIWAQDNGHGKTVRCQLLGVQFYKDGDSFGGGTPPSEDDFDDLGVGSTEDFEEESLV